MNHALKVFMQGVADGYSGDDVEVSTGALQREDPMPPGRYWIDVPTSEADDFEAWRKRNTVKVISSQELKEGGFGTGSERRGVRVLFEVERATELPTARVGFPTIAGESQTIDETFDEERAPEVEVLDPVDVIGKTGEKIATGFFVLAGVATIGVIIAVASKAS